MLMSAEIRGCVAWFIYFLDLLWVRYKRAKFHYCRICVTYFREGGFFALPAIHEQPWKGPSWIGLTEYILLFLLSTFLKICRRKSPEAWNVFCFKTTIKEWWNDYEITIRTTCRYLLMFTTTLLTITHHGHHANRW